MDDADVDFSIFFKRLFVVTLKNIVLLYFEIKQILEFICIQILFCE
jgi:hypothetical protein